MEEQSEKKFRNQFVNTNLSTFKFVLLSLATGGMWVYMWEYNLCETINRHEKRTIIPLAIPIVLMVLYTFFLDVSEDSSIEYLIIVLACLIISIVLDLCISFMSKPILEKMFAENGMPRKLNPVLCFLFPGFYQYYAIYNIEEYISNNTVINNALLSQRNDNDEANKLNKIEKLAKLRNEGIINNEEFEIEKKKILDN